MPLKDSTISVGCLGGQWWSVARAVVDEAGGAACTLPATRGRYQQIITHGWSRLLSYLI